MEEKPRKKFLRFSDPRKMNTEDLISILLGHGSTSTNETVEKHDFDCVNYTETQGFNAILGNDPFIHHL